MVRLDLTGLGADGRLSYITFGAGWLVAPVYEWRNAAGNELITAGFDNFKKLYNDKNTNPVEWDIKQLKDEQQALQSIHEKYLEDRKFFNAVSKAITNSDVIKWSEDQQINGGIDILDYNSRIKYGCKLLGYGENEGCKP